MSNHTILAWQLFVLSVMTNMLTAARRSATILAWNAAQTQPGGKGQGANAGGEQCPYCGRKGHKAEECWYRPPAPQGGGKTGAAAKGDGKGKRGRGKKKGTGREKITQRNEALV